MAKSQFRVHSTLITVPPINRCAPNSHTNLDRLKSPHEPRDVGNDAMGSGTTMESTVSGFSFSPSRDATHGAASVVSYANIGIIQ